MCCALLESILILDAPVPKADGLICLWRRAPDIFVWDIGDQDLIGQAFLRGSSAYAVDCDVEAEARRASLVARRRRGA